MPDLTRQDIFARAARKLRAEFSELSNIPHSALKGGEAETLVKRFLSRHLPKRFDVGAGFIIDPEDHISKQTDVVIFDAFNCPMYRASEDASIFPSDNVAAVVEVKSSLDKHKLQEAFANIAAVKDLKKTKLPNTEGPVQVQTLGCLFAFESPLRMDTLTSHFVDCVREYGLGRHIDVAIVLDVALFSMMVKLPGHEWTNVLIEEIVGEAYEGTHFAAGCMLTGEDSLDGFLRFLLAQLMLFRPFLPHPGFAWERTASRGQGLVQYVGSFTQETDPERREDALKKYQREVELGFKERTIPRGFGP